MTNTALCIASRGKNAVKSEKSPAPASVAAKLIGAANTFFPDADNLEISILRDLLSAICLQGEQ